MENSKKIIAIDSQMLEGIQLCPRKWYYSFIRQLQSNTTKDYFQRGDLLHKMLERYYNELISGTDRSIAGTRAEQYGTEYAAELSLSTSDCDEAIQNFIHYCIYYNDDSWIPLYTEKVAAKIIYEDENYQFQYQGKIDLIVRIPNVPGLIPIDHKSVKRRGTEMDLSNQFMGYCWLLGVSTLIKNEIGFQKTVPVKERMRRMMFSYDAERISEWVENSISSIKLLIYYIETEKWPMNLSSCNKFDGCTFAPLCSTGSSNRERRIEQLYNIRETKWDVGTGL